MRQIVFPGMGVSLQEKIEHAYDLLREYEEAALELSPDGYGSDKLAKALAVYDKARGVKP